MRKVVTVHGAPQTPPLGSGPIRLVVNEGEMETFIAQDLE